MADYKVAIVGAGFCGTMVAAHLARLVPDMPVALIERNFAAGPGLACGTVDAEHLLNVRAERMGAFPEEPDHFWQWLKTQSDLPPMTQNDFAPRMVFGFYLTDILQKAKADNSHLDVLHRRIVDIRRSAQGFTLMSADGQVLTAERVVLALGNFPPDQLSDNTDDMNPYAPATWSELAVPGDILIVGTGLTSLDLLVTLAKRKATGTLHLLSRHGLLPREHTDPKPYTLTMKPPYPVTARGLCQALRKEIAAAPETPWQSVVDALRPLNQTLWQGMNQSERRRFLRHLRVYWDVHRHRCAPQIMDIYRGLEQAGRVVLHHGSIVQQTITEKGVDVVWRPRGTASLEKLTVRKVVRCTGPQSDLCKLGDPLVQSLLARDLLTADELRLGVVVDNYVACNSAGDKVEGLYVLGSMLRGKLYESVAVPELRGQAADVARIAAREATS